MRFRSYAIGAVLAGALTLLGCGPSREGPGPLGDQPEGVIVWADDEDRPPGIGRMSVFYRGDLFVVWSDSDRGGGGSSTANAHGVQCDGFLLGPDGARIEFRCASPDGKAGSATIQGRAYDLAQGGLFLIRSRGDTIQALQLDRELRTEGLSGPRLREIAEADPEIRAFFTGEGDENR